MSDDTTPAILAAAQALGLRSRGRATHDEIARLEAAVGAKLPQQFARFFEHFNGCENTEVGFDGHEVLFDDVEQILDAVGANEIEGMGGVPFAHDFFGGVWLLMLNAGRDGSLPGRVDFMAVQERYIDPDNPIEHRAPDFERFLARLGKREAED